MPKEQDILKRCVDAFKVARITIADAIDKLYTVHQQEAWKGSYSSFTEFCEDGLKISHSTASQYVQVYKHYVVEGSLAANRLQEVDTSKLYLLIDAPGSVEKKLEMAKSLSRQELRANRVEEVTGQECTHEVHICAKCHKRV